jgi:hypothetical protein
MRAAFSFAVLLMLTGAGCRSEPDVAAPPIIRVRISPETITLQVQETVQLQVQAINVSAAQGFLWQSRDPSVAEVSASGLVTGRANGRTVIIARPVADTMSEGGAEVIVVP